MTKGDANEAPDADLISQSHITGKVGFTLPKIGWITIGIHEITSATTTAISNLPNSLSNFAGWLMSQGLVIISAIALTAFSGLFFGNRKDQRRMKND